MAVINKRVGKKDISYQAIIRVKGYKTICKTFDKKTKAIDWAKKIETKMKDGTYKEIPEELEKKLNTEFKSVADLIQYYKENIAPQKYSYAEKYNVMYDWWIDKIGNVRLIDLSAPMISSCRQLLISEKIKKKGKEVTRGNSTINKYLMCLSAVLTYAVKELELIEYNPVSKVGTVTKPSGRKRFLSTEEIPKLINGCKEHSDFLYIFVLISISTGGRYSEVLNLKVKNFNFENNQVFYLDTKNKEDRGVPIDESIMKIIKDYINEHNITNYLFWNKKSGKLYYIRGFLQNVIKNVGLEDFHIHDLRHTTASYIAMTGGSLLDIADILGHKTLVMARRYSHLTKQHTATVLSKVTNKILPEI